MIAIIDYQMGNFSSVQKAFKKAGGNAIITSDKGKIISAKAVVLPGVGAFGDGIKELKKLGLIKIIKDFIAAGKPFLGICLGMQLLFEESQEAPGVKGLGILEGRVKRFPSGGKLKVPHMGWNQIKSRGRLKPPLLKGISDGSYVYFVHSYYCRPRDKNIVVAETNYGIDFPAMICRENILGCQFHPEKSQDIGLRILRNFIRLC